MSLGLVGRKVGMTRIFTEDGDAVPVTVLDMSGNRVSQIKTVATDGYDAIQVAWGTRKPSRVNKPLAGHFAKAGIEPARGMTEFRVSAEVVAKYQPGAAITVEIFQPGQLVDVSGITQGKGFAGTIKRHNFNSQRASHGNSLSHNVPGSTGQAQDPGRVFPGKRMPGHMGAVKRTVQNLKIVRIDVERQLLLVKGSVPGAKGGVVVVRPAVKGGA